MDLATNARIFCTKPNALQHFCSDYYGASGFLTLVKASSPATTAYLRFQRRRDRWQPRKLIGMPDGCCSGRESLLPPAWRNFSAILRAAGLSHFGRSTTNSSPKRAAKSPRRPFRLRIAAIEETQRLPSGDLGVVVVFEVVDIGDDQREG